MKTIEPLRIMPSAHWQFKPIGFALVIRRGHGPVGVLGHHLVKGFQCETDRKSWKLSIA